MDRKKIDSLIKKLKRLDRNIILKRSLDREGTDDDCGGDN